MSIICNSNYPNGYTSSKLYSRNTPKTERQRKFENKACGKLHQTNVCKQKAGMADSKSVRKNSRFRPLRREKWHIMTSISTANELLYITNYNSKTHRTKLWQGGITIIKNHSHSGEFCISWWIKQTQTSKDIGNVNSTKKTM